MAGSRQQSSFVSDGKHVPPQAIEAEQSVLGGILLDERAWDKIADRINENDFYRMEHRIIFKALESLVSRNKPLDVITLSEFLKNENQLDSVGGEVNLYELVKNVPTAANIVAYADIVRERSVFRQLIHISQDIADSAYQPQGRQSKELLDSAEQKIFSIAEQGTRQRGPQEIKNLLVRTVEKVDELYHSDRSIVGLSTGYRDLDNLTSGIQPGELAIIAGRPSMGKTAFAMNIAEFIAISEKKPVLVFSMEMPAESLTLRMLSSLGRIDQLRMRTGKLTDDDWPRVTSTVSMLSECQIYIDDTPALSPTEMRARARRLSREVGGLGLVVIDYLQLMQVLGFRENRTMEISEISRSLKTLASELNVAVIAVSQLNRSLESRPNKRPMMSDLRESGAIEQDADLIMFIYRDEVYNENTPDKGVAEIIIAKQRNGPIGTVRLTFLSQCTRFENYAPTTFVVEAPVAAEPA